MCGGASNPFGFGFQPPQAWGQGFGLGQSFYDQQMQGMRNLQAMYGQMVGMQNQSSRFLGTPQSPPKKKKCVCAYCGRPSKPEREDACPGCGAWEVEFK
jgi:hypothetical protein